MLIRDYEIEVDVAEELEPYMDHFSRATVRGNKLQACSPFRQESTPSFAVNLDNGTWIDSGASDDYWMKGNFIKLLTFLMAVTYEEAEAHLLEKYRTILADVDSLTLDIQLESQIKPPELHLDMLKPFAYRSSYLAGRGISEQVQRSFKIGYDRKGKAVVIPWLDKDGKLINIKFRKVDNKIFWYLQEGQPIKQHVYGLHFIYRMNVKKAFLVESETDALYLWTHGVPAVALGSASLSKRQEELLLNSPLEEIVLAFDRDNAGNRARENVSKRLLGKLKLWSMPIPDGCKDINDIKPSLLQQAVERVEELVIKFL